MKGEPFRADDNTDLAIIGGGPAGYTAAFLAADLGMAVTLIDPQKNPGGTCLYRGCIPSKALLHVAGLVHEAQLEHTKIITDSHGFIQLDERRRTAESHILAAGAEEIIEIVPICCY